ncbi:MAG: sensor histidine kinase [Leptothrix sp. (in: b-proteobacteria)]
MWLLPAAASAAATDAQWCYSTTTQPPADDGGWQALQLPTVLRALDANTGPAPEVLWVRLTLPAPPPEARNDLVLYFPYLNSGQLLLNGQLLGELASSDPSRVVRWERPHLISVPPVLLQPGAQQVLHLRLTRQPDVRSWHLPAVVWGSRTELQARYETRLFWVRVVPQITVVVCLLTAAGLAFLWRLRRAEQLYAILGMAAALWGLRTLTFVIEQIPADGWLAWRALYFGATGGFIVAMALFALRFAHVRRPGLERLLLGYWLLGPLLVVIGGVPGEALAGRFWSAGLIPIGLLLLALTVLAVWRLRSLEALALLVALAFAVLAGVHDYLLAWSEPVFMQAFPVWSAQRLFLLHHAANGLLLVTAGILVARFAASLNEVERLNSTLEQRITAREAELSLKHQQLTRLENQRAVEEERRRIVRDMHDGLGSQLFTSLSRLERGALPTDELAEMLRRCIAEVRLTIDALSPAEDDFASVLGNFRYRWDSIFAAAQIQTRWHFAAPDELLNRLPAHHRLHVLRILQEALTNVLKHAKAQTVAVTISTIPPDNALQFVVQDDGQGFTRPGGDHQGRGLVNMQARAASMAAQLNMDADPHGCRLQLVVPVTA